MDILNDLITYIIIFETIDYENKYCIPAFVVLW